MTELGELLKDIVQDGVKQDKALLDLVSSVIERLIHLEEIVATLTVTATLNMETIRIQNETISKLKELLREYSKGKVN